jgi:hypothetical protein
MMLDRALGNSLMKKHCQEATLVQDLALKAQLE